MSELEKSAFVNAFSRMQKKVHATAVEHGWWAPRSVRVTQVERLDGGEPRMITGDFIVDVPHNQPERLALMHSEISEVLEGLRADNPPDKHCPQHTSVEIELADVIIRIMDFAQFYGYDVAGAIVDKAAINNGRPYKHGGKKF